MNSINYSRDQTYHIKQDQEKQLVDENIASLQHQILVLQLQLNVSGKNNVVAIDDLQMQLDNERANAISLVAQIKLLQHQLSLSIQSKASLDQLLIELSNERANVSMLQKQSETLQTQYISDIATVKRHANDRVMNMTRHVEEIMRQTSMHVESLMVNISSQQAEIDRYKLLLSTTENEITQMKSQMKILQSSSSSSSSSYAATGTKLRRHYSINPEVVGILSSVMETSKVMSQLMTRESWSAPHKYSPHAIFSCALSLTYINILAKFFANTARSAGFDGDIVVAVLPSVKKELLDVLRSNGVIVYTASMECTKKTRTAPSVCEFMNEKLPITLMRSFIYQYWALQYPDTTYIMMSDFRDVLFQSNPFTLKSRFSEWGPSAYDITFFAEHHPNRVINRCKHTSTTLNYCYGRSITDQIGTSTIINNGVVFATRNASLIYVSFTLICKISSDG